MQKLVKPLKYTDSNHTQKAIWSLFVDKTKGSFTLAFFWAETSAIMIHLGRVDQGSQGK